jgi:hypothetical protein
VTRGRKRNGYRDGGSEYGSERHITKFGLRDLCELKEGMKFPARIEADWSLTHIRDSCSAVVIS